MKSLRNHATRARALSAPVTPFLVSLLWLGGCVRNGPPQLDRAECTASVREENGSPAGSACSAACPDLSGESAELRACNYQYMYADGGHLWSCYYRFSDCEAEQRWRLAPRDAGPRCETAADGTCRVVGVGLCCPDEALAVDGARGCLALTPEGHATYTCAIAEEPACSTVEARQCFKSSFIPVRTLVFQRPPSATAVRMHGLQPCDAATADAALAMQPCN